jgi:hypothetical protein
MRDRQVIDATQTITENAHASLRVTFGVTWGKRAYISASSKDLETERKRVVTGPELAMAACANMGLGGKFVETTDSAVWGGTPKSLKKMVGTTGIEPVTPTMSR